MVLSSIKLFRAISLSLILVILLAACQQTTPTATQTSLESTEIVPADSEVIEGTESPGTINTPPLTAESSTQPEASQDQSTDQPTPAPTLADWRDAPISPESISDRVLEIYQRGQTLGRDPLAFSVIGDCQSIPYVFMGPFSRGELEPAPAESQLWNAINAFEPSFKRWAVTARGGFTAASILNPLQADAELCKPGETPLTCEFRLNNPAFVIITLETWLDPESIDRYEIYLRQIVDTVIEKGAVPILLTKADSSELRNGTHIINPVVVRVAYENQLPLVNFWRAAQYLDNFGIDPEREGFHLSQAGYNLKNTLALRALYQVWTAVESTQTEAVEETIAPTATPEPTPENEIHVDIPDCASGCIFFGTAISRDGEIVSGGVYAYAVESQALMQVLPEGFDLQDVSVDGNQLLINSQSELFKINLQDGTAELISETFNYLGAQGAYWLSNDEGIVFLDTNEPIQTNAGEAFHLIPVADDDTRYYEIGSCSSKDFCKSEGIFQQNLDGSITKLDKFIQPTFSPDGSEVAYLNPDAATEENYGHIWYLILEETAAGASSRRVLYLPEESGFMVYPEVKDYAFSPGSNQLLILYNVYSEYYRYSLRLQTYLWNLDTGILYDYGKLDGASGSLEPRLVWSPEGDRILFFLTEPIEEGSYDVSIYQTDLITGEKLVLLDRSIFSSSDFFYITNIYWR